MFVLCREKKFQSYFPTRAFCEKNNCKRLQMYTSKIPYPHIYFIKKKKQNRLFAYDRRFLLKMGVYTNQQQRTGLKKKKKHSDKPTVERKYERPAKTKGLDKSLFVEERAFVKINKTRVCCVTSRNVIARLGRA